MSVHEHQLLQDNIIVFVGCHCHVQSTQNSKFAICSQYFKKQVRDKFLHADKHQTFLQIDTINFGGYG